MWTRVAKCLAMICLLILMNSSTANAQGLLFSEVGEKASLQYLCLGIGIVVLILVLLIPNALRRAGKMPKGW